MSIRNRLLPGAVWLGIGLVWGTTWGVIRIGLRDLEPLTFAASRTMLAAVTLLVMAQIIDGSRRPKRREVWFWLAIGLPQIGVPYALIFWAEQYISSGLTAILFATFPAFTTVAAHFLLRDERLSFWKASGAALALVSVVLLMGPTQGAVPPPPIVAVAAVLVASVASAVGAVTVRRHGRGTSTLWLTALQVSSATVLLGALAVTLERDASQTFTAAAIGSIVYLALAVTVGCYLGLFWLLKRLEATFVSMGVIFETAVGVFLGRVALSEPLGWRLLGGLSVMGLSIYLVTIRRRGVTAVGPP